MSAEATEAALARLREDGAAPATVASFERAVGLVASGDSGLIAEGVIEPVDSVEEYAALEPAGHQGAHQVCRLGGHVQADRY
ncbi:MAG: hypothetical protein ACKOTH_12135, partial [Solirubrobacterales bacterium]